MSENNEQIRLRPARLGRTLKRGFSDAYDRLGMVVVASLIWSIATFGPIAIGWEVQSHVRTGFPWILAIGVLIGLLMGTPTFAGVFTVARRIVFREDPAIMDVFVGFRRLFWSSYGLLLANIIVVGVLLTDIAFFFGWFGPLKGNVVAYITGSLAIYVLIGWFAALMYQFPILAAQELLGQKRGAIQAIKKSLLLVLDNPGFTIGLFVVILGFSVLCVYSRVGMLILYVGTLSIVLTWAVRELYIRYGVVEDPADVDDQT